MLHIVLHQPEIPANTGNIIRLCANSGAVLHLIYPLGFELDDKRMRRAGLDYHEWADIVHYQNELEFLKNNQNRRIFACSTKGKKSYSEMQYQLDDMFLFGAESKGLPHDLRESLPNVRIPMCPNNRSLNLSNSVAIILFEAWRQLDFIGSVS
ncbi:MAG: tRNA (uridine(34)/cytosine(34)/5-carboxymethylaminomethyluridine(34)-2'-O)-methyltransferase TrmL [Tatlockia sp.]|nr:tRNA (uridine(34)/cytosine(34)/5-carboxymethylaminomethyluridine(34)-2'-O)-methyltransferase TrmL [Tatlockia sp.]